MALPMMQAPIYNTIIPSTKKVIKFRPFLVKEEKALLLAQQSEDSLVMVDTLKSIISNCVVEDINPDELAIFDFEYLFTQIRAKSVGEKIELMLLCDTCTDENAKAPINLDLTKFEVVFPEGHDNKIQLSEDVGVVMKNPDLNMLNTLDKIKDGDVESTFNLIAGCVDYIYNTDQVFYLKEEPKQAIIDFLENLTQDQFRKIESFFSSIPKMSQKIEFDCPVCNAHHVKIMEGLQSFF